MKVWRSLGEGKTATFLRSYPKTSGIVAAIGIPAMAVVAMVGGFAEGEGGPPKVAPGKAVEAMPFEVTIHDAAITSTPPGSTFRKSDRVYLRVRVHATSQADQPLTNTYLTNAVAWGDMARERDKFDLSKSMATAGEIHTEEHARDVYRVDDNSYFTGGLNPGISADVYLVWELPKENLPKELTLTVQEHTFAEVTNMKEENRWLRGDGVAEVTLPVRVIAEQKKSTSR